MFLPKLVLNYESNKNSQEFVDRKPIEKQKDFEEPVKPNDLEK